MAGAWEKPRKVTDLGWLFFPRPSKGELSAPGNRDPQRQGPARVTQHVSGRGLSPSFYVDGKIKWDNDYRQTPIESLPVGDLILEIEYPADEMMSVQLYLTKQNSGNNPNDHVQARRSGFNK